MTYMWDFIQCDFPAMRADVMLELLIYLKGTHIPADY